MKRVPRVSNVLLLLSAIPDVLSTFQHHVLPSDTGAVSNGGPAGDRPYILVVVNHDSLRASLREFIGIGLPGCTVLEAATGAQARQLCTQHGPELAVVDIRLPDASGIELTESLLARAPGLKVIVISLLGEPGYAAQALAAGAAAYILKDDLAKSLLPAIDAARAPAGR